MKKFPTIGVSVCLLIMGIGLLSQGEYVSAMQSLGLSVLLANSVELL